MLRRVNVQEPGGAAGIVPKHSLSSQPRWVLAACSHGPGCQEGSQCSSARDKLGTLSPQQRLAAFLDPAPGGAHCICGERLEDTRWAGSSLPPSPWLVLETCLL